MNLLSKNFIDTYTNKLSNIIFDQSIIILILCISSLIHDRYLLFHYIIKVIFLTNIASIVLIFMLFIILIIYEQRKY